VRRVCRVAVCGPMSPLCGVQDTLSIEDSMRLPMNVEPAKLLEAAGKGELPEESAGIVTLAKEPDGSSVGRANKDVQRYSKDGLRSAMTASWST